MSIVSAPGASTYFSTFPLERILLTDTFELFEMSAKERVCMRVTFELLGLPFFL